MDLRTALTRKALRALPGSTLFRVALALRNEQKQEAAKRLGVTSSTVSMYLDPPRPDLVRAGAEPTRRRITEDLAERVEAEYGVPRGSWERAER